MKGDLFLTLLELFENTTIRPVEFRPLNHLDLRSSFLWVNCMGNLFLKIRVFREAPEVTPHRCKENSLTELKYLDSNFRRFYFLMFNRVRSTIVFFISSNIGIEISKIVFSTSFKKSIWFFSKGFSISKG